MIYDIGEAMEDNGMKNLSEEELDSAMICLTSTKDGMIEWDNFKEWFDELTANEEEEEEETEDNY